MHPILFHLPLPGFLASLFHVSGNVPITSYGVMLGISLIVGWFLTLGLASRDGLPREAMANCYVDAAILALLGSRLLFILTNPSDLTSDTTFFQFRSGGLVAYGGFLGAFVGSYLSLRFGIGVTGLFRVLADLVSRKKSGPWRPLPLMPWADATAPSAALAIFVTRIGCYLNGCDFGRPLSATAPNWLVRAGTFPHWPDAAAVEQGIGSPAWKQHLDEHLIASTADASLPVHPTQIYESLVGLGLFFAMFAFRKQQKFRGEVFLWFVILYGGARFLLELVRDDLQRGNLPPAEPAHVLYPVCLGALGIAFAAGVAPRIETVLVRRVAQVVALAPAIATYVAFKPQTFENVTPVELSTSQAVALFSGLAACAAFAVLHRAAARHPESAMALPDFSDWADDDELDEDTSDAEESNRSPRPNRRIRSAGEKKVEADVEADEADEAPAAPPDPRADSEEKDADDHDEGGSAERPADSMSDEAPTDGKASDDAPAVEAPKPTRKQPGTAGKSKSKSKKRKRA